MDETWADSSLPGIRVSDAGRVFDTRTGKYPPLYINDIGTHTYAVVRIGDKRHSVARLVYGAFYPLADDQRVITVDGSTDCRLANLQIKVKPTPTPRVRESTAHVLTGKEYKRKKEKPGKWMREAGEDFIGEAERAVIRRDADQRDREDLQQTIERNARITGEGY